MMISGTIFGLVALLHLLRAVNQWPFQLGPWFLPQWASWFWHGNCGRSMFIGLSPVNPREKTFLGVLSKSIR